jgi:pimeloyl-ACP methyl ester carboxylesterase
MVPATTQPAPKGILFIHTGGPDPALQASFATAFSGDTFGRHLEYVRNNFDIVSVDQRGMGLSSLELLYGIQPDMLGVYNEKKVFLQLIGALKDNNGPLFSNINISVSPDTPPLVGETPCKLEESGVSNIFEPFDYTSDSEVDAYLTNRTIAIKYCSDKFDKDDGEGKKYSPLQFVGTGALTYDMEYMRLAFGGPKISILGYSYGTRVAAAYASAFPYNMLRMGVTGTMAPIPDLIEYAQKAAKNTAEILGWIVSQCALAKDKCSKNPWPQSPYYDPNITYYEGGIDDAVNELFSRSMDGGRWYKENCDTGIIPVTLKGLTQFMQNYLTTSGPVGAYQDSTWPYGFAALPALVYNFLDNPCSASNDLGTLLNLQITQGVNSIAVFQLIPALDMTGRFDKTQAVAFFTTFAKDPLFAPGLNMFSLYASNTYGWPQLPMPIGFSNQNVPAVIANGLYDERTGMAYAQDFKLHFPNSSLVTSLSGGHCVGYDQGAEAWDLLLKFLAYGTKPLDGTVTGHYIPIDFEKGVDVLVNAGKYM